jgi:hypothetical protein
MLETMQVMLRIGTDRSQRMPITTKHAERLTETDSHAS